MLQKKKVHNEKFYDSYFSPNITVFKSKRMRWTEHVESIRKKENFFTKLSENMNEGGYLGDLEVEGKILVVRELR